MTDPTFESIEATLDRARDAEDEGRLLRAARADVERLRATDVDDRERLESLAVRIDQRIREAERQDEYSGGLGAAMNPDEDNAP